MGQQLRPRLKRARRIRRMKRIKAVKNAAVKRVTKKK